ncbi:MAG: ATP synthase F1 subunit gamma [Candidatus Aminicenantes bacterium]
MPALIDLRRRIKSVRNTQQITQAMKTVATAKLRKAQRLVMESRPYWHSYSPVISEISFWAERHEHPLLMKRKEKRIEAVVMTSDKGLCGAFNSNLLEKAVSFVEEKAQKAEVQMVLIGKKAVSLFRSHPFPSDRIYQDNVDKLTSDDLKDLARFLMNLYITHKTDAVYVLYNEFKSILAPRITAAKILPIEVPPAEAEKAELPLAWEPQSGSLLSLLLPLYVENQICHAFFESSAAEQASRMMAMDNATQNAEDLIGDLTLVLNKMRQASITKELLEIMTAVNELAKK